LHLRDDALEYLESWKVKQIINKYSDHISLPIEMQKEVWQEEEVAEGEEPKGGQMVKTDEWEAINSASALWTRSKVKSLKSNTSSFIKISAMTLQNLWHGRITVLKVVLNIRNYCIFQVKPNKIFYT
jgi:HSP90 family molecular chaperone